MNHQNLIFDISSDEEFGFENSSTADNFDWITKLLEDVPELPLDYSSRENSNCDAIDVKIGGNNKINDEDDDDDDDDDDVVVVGEVIVNPKRAKRSVPAVINGGLDDDDDDCVVLECDPDKPPPSTAAVEDVKGCDGGDSDDLVVVGEKGQVACRDFPHSRHLCANFPFSSTPHESRCDMCHCYVCDSLAPCSLWGSGASSTDHCHATDKGAYWQTERQNIRLLKNPLLLTPKPVVPVAQFPKQASPQPCSLPRVASTCGVSPSFGVPNIISHGRSQRPSVAVGRNRFQPHLVSRQLLRPCSSNTQGNRVAHLPSAMNSSRRLFKRPGFSFRSEVADRAAYCAPDNVSGALSQPPNQLLAVNPIRNSFSNVRKTPRVVLSPNSCPSTQRTLPSHLQDYGLPSPHTPTSRFQGCVPAAVMSDSQYTYSSVHQAQTTTPPVIPSNTATNLQSSLAHSATTHNISGPNFACPTSEMLSSVTQSSHQAPQGCSSNPYDHSSVHQAQTISPTVIPCNSARASQSSLPHSSKMHNIPGPTSELLSSVTQSSHQVPPGSSSNPSSNFNVSNSVTQSCHPLLVLNTVAKGEVPMPVSVPSAENHSQTTPDFDIDTWLNNVPDESFFDMSSQASMTDPVDAGMLFFDFETSWQGLTHS